MTVYDTTHELARQIKNSREYIEYKEMKDLINSKPELKKKVDEFEKLRYNTQVLTMQGEKDNTEKMKRLQEMYSILVADSDIKKYFDMEVRFNVMLADINKIIGEAVKEVL